VRLKEIREAKGLTQIELARRANLTQPFISELENGVRSNRCYQALQKLATALGISVSELLGETQPKAAGE